VGFLGVCLILNILKGERMIEDTRLDPPETADYGWVWDLSNDEVIDLLVENGVAIEDQIREQLIDILENG